MRFVDIQFTQGIHGFQAGKCTHTKILGVRETHITLKRAAFACPKCGAREVARYPARERAIRALPAGRCACVLHVQVHKIYCKACAAISYEQLPFLSSPKARVTRQLERTIVELRAEMSISAVAAFYHVPWQTVKDIEKDALTRKYARVRLKDVTRIGIDEIYVFPKASAGEKYLTVVRDLDTGAVLEVARGKGVRALDAFAARLRRFAKNITLVCMDMSNAYHAWVAAHLPNAQVVFDHFHVIKAMNDKPGQVRRRVTRAMDADTRAAVKGARFLFLRNTEHLKPGDAAALATARAASRDLSDAYLLKEKLRSIYAGACCEYTAGVLLEAWCALADATGVDELAAMAKTLRNHAAGIRAYWRFHGASNASQEGFNTKIRWLISQAYGYHDYEYFRLKIFDLPNISIKKAL